MPELPNVKYGDVGEWLVDAGDHCVKDQEVFFFFVIIIIIIINVLFLFVGNFIITTGIAIYLL